MERIARFGSRRTRIVLAFIVIVLIGTLIMFYYMNQPPHFHSIPKFYKYRPRTIAPIPNIRPTKLWPNITVFELPFSKKEDKEYSIKDIAARLQLQLPNLPLLHYFRKFHNRQYSHKTCSRFPPLQYLNYYNTYWQTFYHNQTILQLYGAYYDNRPATGAVVRILAMSNTVEIEHLNILCQFWFEDAYLSVFSKIKEYRLIWYKEWGVDEGLYYPFLISCDLPFYIDVDGTSSPQTVSLVNDQCEMANNSLRIISDEPAVKEQFAVCVKGLDFPHEDLSGRLVEWLELLKILGVHKVYMYQYQVHSNISKVLDYYQQNGFVELQNITQVGGVQGQPEFQHWLMKNYLVNKRLNELIPYNDCFYRNMYKYDYIAVLDIDEIIIPKGTLKTWREMVASAHPWDGCAVEVAALCGTNVYYPGVFEKHIIPENLYPPYMHMLNHGYRFVKHSSPHRNAKCLHNTKQVLTVHNHYPLAHINGYCRPWDFPTTTAQLQHYRDIKVTDRDLEKTHQLMWEDNLDRFKEPLVKRCTNVLKELKLIN